jgi:hypothetical protein
MRLLAATLVAGLAVGLCAGGDDKAGKKDLKPAQAFKEWGDYFVGGVWTTTDARGKKEEVRFEWILDKSFIRLTWKIGEESREEIHGIDPATGQWTIWGFDSKGRAYKGVGESAKAGEWSYRVSGQGKDGPLSWKAKDVKLGPDEERYEIQESTLDGKKQPPEVQVWKRTK